MFKIDLTDPTMDRRAALCQIVGNPSEPYKVEGVRRAVRVLDRLEGEGSELLLEDADYTFLKQCVASAKFIRADRAVLALVDAVLDAQTVEVRVDG